MRESPLPRNAPFFATTSVPRAKTISQSERAKSGRVIHGDACLSMTIFRAPESSAFWRISVESFGSNPNDDAVTVPSDAAAAIVPAATAAASMRFAKERERM